MVIAIIALVAALGGAAYAALKLPKNSVGTKQIRNNAVTGAKVKDGSLKPTDVRNVVDRARGTGDQQTTGTPASYPLRSATWTQQASEVDELLATVDYTTPAACSGFTFFGTVQINVDGKQVASALLNPAPASTQTVMTASGFLPEPGAKTRHTASATISGGCSGAGQVWTVHSISVDVLGFG